MTIREYFETLTEEDREATEMMMYITSQEDPEDFESWALENGIDLDATDPVSGEYVTVLWSWDMCGD